MEEIELYLEDAKESMQKALKHTELELSKIRAGKASPNMLDGIMVDYYGVQSPIQNVSSITSPEARTLSVKPWEKGMMTTIEKAIRDANLGYNPQNNGESILINIPPMTEERRRNLVKQSKSEGEDGKVRIRTIRKDTNDELKKLLKEGASEDEVKAAEEKVQTLTNDYIALIEQTISKKEAEIMTI